MASRIERALLEDGGRDDPSGHSEDGGRDDPSGHSEDGGWADPNDADEVVGRGDVGEDSDVAPPLLAPAPPLPIGTLYVVATPIGNLEDITLRALRVLRAVSVIAAEDARRTRSLLTRHGIPARLIGYREANRAAATTTILETLRTGTVALVSDAGMPLISDPGAELVRRVVAEGGRVEALPGANAALTALVVSGLPPAPFSFVGFPSRQRGDRRAQLAALADRPDTLVFYEAPHRLGETLQALQDALGDRAAAACRELTKLHEEVRRGTLGELRAHFAATAPRGEFTLVVAGAASNPGAENRGAGATDADIEARLRAAMESGEDMRGAVAALAAATGHPRRAIYARWQALRSASTASDDG